MKLNPNCVRDILISMEDCEYKQILTIDELNEKLSSYSAEEISYCCLKLSEANYIDIDIGRSVVTSGVTVRSVNDITFYGHEFLNNIRSDSIWNNVKEVGKKVGATSINSLTQIASGVVTTLIKSQLGI